MNYRSGSLFVLLFAVGCSSMQIERKPANAQVPQITRNETPLFSSLETVQFKIVAPFSTLFASRTKERDEAKKAEIQGEIQIAGRSIPVKIRMRGKSSLRACSFPKLTLKIPRAGAVGTLFEGSPRIDIGTHCGEPNPKNANFYEAMKFNHREALLYRWLQILDIPAFAARSAIITYQDTAKSTQASGQNNEPASSNSTQTHDAFLLEDFSSFVLRAHAVEIRPKQTALDENEIEPALKYKKAYSDITDPQIDRMELTRIANFQAMIGNSDFNASERFLWNLKLLELPDGRWFPAPMDLNYAEVANARVPDGLNFAGYFYDISTPEIRREATLELLSKMELLRATLPELGDDTDGIKAFQQTLLQQAKQLDSQIRN